MLEQVFDLNKFNVYMDNDNYYFFRALNMADSNDIETNITLDVNGKIARIRTNRERFNGIPKYSENDVISLEQITDHIKMHQSKETNCISLTSNANTALTYGRGYYNDKYVMIKVPKKDIGTKVYEAGLYMLNEINDRIKSMVENKEIENVESIKYYLERINNCRTDDQLYNLKNELININMLTNEESDSKEDDLFVKGLNFNVTNSINYISLNDRQNLEKNKIIMKIDLLNKQLLPRIGNKLLIQTVGNAFSSLELIYYKDIEQENIIDLPKELVDVFGLLQQMPDDLEYIDEIKSIVLDKAQYFKFTGSFTYNDFNIANKELTIDNMYEITNGGKIDYKSSLDLYKKAFYLSKSKLRTKRSVAVLNKLLDNNPKYETTVNYILNNGYGIEPEITTRLSKNLVNVSESVSLNISKNDTSLLDYINSLDSNELMWILDNPNKALKLLLGNFIDEKSNDFVSKDEWIADSLIDLLDLKRLGVSFELSDSQRNDIKGKLIENNVVEIYYSLKRQGVSEKDIANVVFTNLIKNKTDIDLSDTFTLEELEWFIGYNKIKGLGLSLRNYQEDAFGNINRAFKDKQFTSVILPTGAGKSYVALAEMFEFEKVINSLNNDSHAKILYLAPNDEILYQLKRIIKDTYRPEEHLGDDIDIIIKRMFPNLTLSTYQNLIDKNETVIDEFGNKNIKVKDIFTEQYDLIIFDELHRTGAKEWFSTIEEMLNHQSDKTKILGITATPERDSDLKDMTDHWARRFGYSREEIIRGDQLSYNLDLVTAIKLGIVSHPKVVNCAYNLKNELDDIKITIDNIVNEELKDELLKKYEKLRRNIESSDGIGKILNDNLKQDGKYIVFLPVTKKCEDEDGNEIFVDEDGNEINKSTARLIIEDYQTLFKQYLYSDEYLKNNQKILILFNKIKNHEVLSDEEINYLNSEKENILLLSKFDLKYNSSMVDLTDNNEFATEIINYMEWEELSKKDIINNLKIKMKDRVEDYSMLASYGKKANQKLLERFNKPTKNKTKLMFVMNKLNEGVHANGISGIVWLRALDENSRILYLQQLGRCIKSLIPGEKGKEEDRPLVIDLVNNTLKVKLNKGEIQEKRDLAKLQYIKSWVNSNKRLPNIDSNDDVEKECAIGICYLQNTYLKYIDNEELLEQKNTDRAILIEEIIIEGSEIDLWSVKYNYGKTSKISENIQNFDDDLFGLFEIKAEIRDFIELKDEIDLYDYTFDYYYNILVKLKENNQPTKITKYDKVKINEDGTVIVVKKRTKKVNDKDILANPEEYNEEGLINVGVWFYRHEAEFGSEEKAKLKQIGYYATDFEIYYGYLEKLKENNQPTNLTNSDKVKINEDGTAIVVKMKQKRENGKEILANPEEYNEEGLIKVGYWFNERDRKGKLEADEKKKLEQIGYYATDFEIYYSYLEKLKENNQPTNLTNSDKVKINEDGTAIVIKKKKKSVDGKDILANPEEYNEEGLIKVGSWFYKHEAEFDADEKKKLEQIGYYDTDFEIYYSYLEKLKENNQPTNLTQSDKVKINEDGTVIVVKKRTKKVNDKDILTNSEEYNEEGLINVGGWFYRHEAEFDVDEKKKLEQIGYYVTDFEIYYGYLEKLKENNQPTKLASDDKVKINEDGTAIVVKKKKKRENGKEILANPEEYKEEGLINVGNWFYKHEAELEADEKKKLEQIGYYATDFEIYYSYLEKLKENNQPTNLTQSDKVKINEDGTAIVVKKRLKEGILANPEEYKEEGLINVGNWFYMHEAELEADEKAKLREIGYVLIEDKKKKYSKSKEEFDQSSKFSQVVNDKKEINNDRKVL